MAGPATLYQAGIHSARPAVGSGCVLYSCTTHNLVYRDDGTAWTTFMTLVGGSGGDIATDVIWDAAGDLVQGTGANTAAKLGAGLAGQTLKSAGAAAANAWAYPPGYEFDYAQITAAAGPTATTEGTADTIITGSAVTYDGATAVVIAFDCGQIRAPILAAGVLTIVLYDNGASIGELATITSNAAANYPYQSMHTERRLTPSNAAHTYSIRAYVSSSSGDIQAGAGGSTNKKPTFMRITKAA
jgi:hypothetical protein